MKYIDAEKLSEQLKHYLDIQPATDGLPGKYSYEARGIKQAIDYALSLIKDSQQEQSDKYEAALEKAREWMPNVNQGGHAILINIFPELGKGLDPRYGGIKQEQPEVDLEKRKKDWHEENASRGAFALTQDEIDFYYKK